MDTSLILTLVICFFALFILPKLKGSSSKHIEMGPNVTEITSTFQFDGIVKSLAPSQLLVIDFSATWCGPCHMIAPHFDQLANSTPQAKFVKIDVDAQRQLAARFQIRAMPTFKFLKGGREIAELKGASPPQLAALVKQHAGSAPAHSAKPATTATPGTGTGASSSSSTTKPPAAPESQSLLSNITSKGLTCLNESSSHPITSILGSNAGPKGDSYLESDVDAELLISIPFNEPCKLKSIAIFSGVSPPQAPKTIKLYVNHLSMDFGDADTLDAAQEIELKPEDVKGEKVDLRFVRFQNVRSLHILVKDNQEDEETTRIDSIDIFGTLHRATVGEVSEKKPLQKIGTDED